MHLLAWARSPIPFHFTVAAAILFLALTPVAMLLYPGGTPVDADTSGYRFFGNFFSDTAHYPNRYAAVYGTFALLLAGYLWLLFQGPRFDSTQGVVVQVTGQKVIAYAAIVTALIGAWGAARVRTRAFR